MVQKNIDIETFYMINKQAIKIACSYIDNDNLDLLIRYCRLKPITIFNKTYKKYKLQTWWVDENGNSLRLRNNKLSVALDDPDIRIDTGAGTDLFSHRSILETMKISKSITLVEDCLIFCGQDDYIRAFNKESGKRVSPLEVNPNLLMRILGNVNAKYKKTKEYIIFGLPNKEIEEIMKEYTND